MIVYQYSFTHLLRAYYGLNSYYFQLVFFIISNFFNVVEAQAELFILKLNVTHYKSNKNNNNNDNNKTVPEDIYGPLVPYHYPEEEKLFRLSYYVRM